MTITRNTKFACVKATTVTWASQHHNAYVFIFQQFAMNWFGWTLLMNEEIECSLIIPPEAVGSDLHLVGSLCSAASQPFTMQSLEVSKALCVIATDSWT